MASAHLQEVVMLANRIPHFSHVQREQQEIWFGRIMLYGECRGG